MVRYLKKKSIKRTNFQGIRKWKTNLIESLLTHSQEWSCLINKSKKKIIIQNTVECPNDFVKETIALFNKSHGFDEISVCKSEFHLTGENLYLHSLWKNVLPAFFLLSVSASTEQNSVVSKEYLAYMLKTKLNISSAVYTCISKYCNALNSSKSQICPLIHISD